MKRIMWLVLAVAVLAPTAGFAQIACSREGLQGVVDLYIAAQTKGDTSGLPLAMGLGYMENAAPANITNGLIKTPMKIDHQRSLLDTTTCQTFTEVIVTNKEHPYVLGTRLRVNHDKIAEIEILWTTTGYWLFNADAYLEGIERLAALGVTWVQAHVPGDSVAQAVDAMERFGKTVIAAL